MSSAASNVTASIHEALEEHTSILGVRLWIVIVSVLVLLFILLTFLCLCIPSFRFCCRRKSYEPRFRKSHEPRFRLSNPITLNTGLRRSREAAPSGRRLLPINASDVRMDFSPLNQGVQLEAQWSNHKSAPNPPSLMRDVEAFGSHSPPSNMGRTQYTAEEIEVATDGFDEANLIGCGESTYVYRGILFNSTRVAVKELLDDSYNDDEDNEELKLQLDAIKRVTHKNLVKLLGYCLDGENRMLVYEYVDNGNLYDWLHEFYGRVSPLTWDRRMTIIRGTAKGLAYLHEECDPGIIHGDIKSRNIVLDQHWEAKISDIGSAMPFDSRWSPRTPVRASYQKPETPSQEAPAGKTEVYCFGILVMEIITGKCAVDYSHPQVYLIDRVKSMVGNQEVERLLDPKIPDVPPLVDLKRMVLIALMCTDPDLSQRPTMARVVRMVSGHIA